MPVDYKSKPGYCVKCGCPLVYTPLHSVPGHVRVLECTRHRFFNIMILKPADQLRSDALIKLDRLKRLIKKHLQDSSALDTIKTIKSISSETAQIIDDKNHLSVDDMDDNTKLLVKRFSNLDLD